MRVIRLPMAIAIVLSGACGPGPQTEPAPDPLWEASVAQWKAKRDEGLRRPTGWLSLAGLYWLDEGENRFGSDPANELVFPQKAPARLGVLYREGTTVTVEIEPGFEVLAGGEPLTSQPLVSDAQGEATVLEYESLSFYVIERGERVGVRLKDSASELLASFDGMDYFPLDEAWRVAARFELYEEPRTILIPNILGDSVESSAPGVAVFEIAGREYRLEPTGDPEDKLFFVFGDETNGDSTYGGGRFLYAGPPAADGSLTLDFNRTYNPPCVFTPYATCPLPRPEDKLALVVEAGERMFGQGH